MARYKRKATLRYIRTRDAFQLKKDDKKVEIKSKLFFVLIDNDGWPPYYFEEASLVKEFFDKYKIYKTDAAKLTAKRRNGRGARIIVLVKREK